MSTIGAASRGATQPTTGLRHRVRAETAQSHAHVEALTDIPGTVHTRADYVALLRRWHALHAGFEVRLTAGVFDSAWRAVGVDMAMHRRAHLLADDIDELVGAASHRPARPARLPRPGQPVRPVRLPRPVGPIRLPPLVTFGHAVGCLYVLEGSSLGGPTVAAMVRERIGEVPTRFLLGEGRPGRAWPAVLDGLRRFEARGGEGDDVVAGAGDTFDAFTAHLSRPAARSGTSARLGRRGRTMAEAARRHRHL